MLKLPGGFGGSGKRYIVGFDLSDSYCALSYCSDKGDIRTVSLVMGSEEYAIPMALSKRHGAGQWFFGNEAYTSSDAGESILVEDIYTKALAGEDTQIDGLVYGAVSLLALYLKRCFGLLQSVGSFDRMDAVMFTLPEVTSNAISVIKESLEGLHIKTDRIFFMAHSESFFRYVINEPDDMIRRNPLLFTVEDKGLSLVKLNVNRFTTPKVVHAEKTRFDLPKDRSVLPDELDNTLLRASQGVSEKIADYSFYLVGEDFSEDILRNSLKYMCSKGRVYGGINLFSRGAVYALLDREGKSDYVFLGDDKLSSNIGMKLLSQGSEVYYALLDAGICWYDAESFVEFYVSGTNVITLSAESIKENRKSDVVITLEGYEGELTRMRLTVSMKDTSVLRVVIEDIGLGAFTRTKASKWEEEIELP